MISLTAHEATLFRMLVGFFGQDQVIPHMSAMAVCGGELPKSVPGVFKSKSAPKNWSDWAKKCKCLFTIVDHQDRPKLVVEFFSGFEQRIDPQELDHEHYLKPLLASAGVRYVTISEQEFGELLDPSSSLDFCTLLQAKVGAEDSSMHSGE